MLIDLATGGAPSEIHADLCIVGTGAAGLSLAQAFAETRFRVCLVESGGFRYEPETQALYQGPVDGVPWLCNLDDCRLRQFGGTTSGDWGGGCTPLDDLDFSPRPWVPHAGWPIEKRELLPYYEQARATFELGPEDFEDPALLEQVISQLVARPLSFDPAVLVSRYYLKSPVHFGDAHRRLPRAQNITLLLHANAVDLETNDTAEVLTGVRVQALSGRTAIVRARAFVLACGGIETPRLLLASNAVEPHGLGNRYDVVGRFFMDHPSGPCGTVIADEPERFVAAYDHTFHWDRRLPIYPTLCLAEPVQRRNRLLNARCRLVSHEADAVPDGVAAIREMLDRLRHRRMPDALTRQLRRIAADLGHVAYAGKRRLLRRGTGPMRLELEGVFEQAPNQDSRITLADERDALGQRRAKLDWRLTALDWRTYRAVAEQFDAQLRRHRLGHLIIAPWLRSEQPESNPQIRGVAHHLGTTRMSSDPRTGVVDRNCRVHGIENLFISSGSVMPTGGFAGPTITIAALGLRLADHLKTRLPQLNWSLAAAEVGTA